MGKRVAPLVLVVLVLLPVLWVDTSGLSVK